MIREGTTVFVTDDDAATLRDIANEYGFTSAEVRHELELGDEPADDELLRPRVAAIYRLALSESAR